MEYRDWTKKDGSGRDISTSLLGYGCMRFPTLPDGRIDEVRAEKLLNTARAAGVNYFDTAFPYHGGESEPFVGRVIAKWPRESFYLATFGDFRPMTDAENAAIRQTADVLRSHIKIGCTGCRYCMPCPMGVDIPDNFSIWNKLGMFGNKDAIRQQWTAHFPDAEKAIHCVRCGKCEAVCPQHLPIRDSLAKLQTELDNL